LIELEPISNPTNGLFLLKKPITLHVLTLGFHRGFRETLWLRLDDELCPFTLSFHPSVQQIFLEPPAISQLEGWNALFTEVLVKGVRRDPQILGCLSQCHNFL